MKAHLCMLFYILGCVLLAAAITAPPTKMQTYSLAIPPLKPQFEIAEIIVNPVQKNCLAEAIYHEGRGESMKTQIMIAEVTINRVKDESKMFPSSICKVVHQSRIKGTCQYSWACKSHPVKDEAAWIRSELLAEWLYRHYYLEQDIPDLTKGSLYFTTIKTHREWMNSMELMAESDSMKFLAEN